MDGRRGLTTTIKYLDGIVGAAQPKGIDKDMGITSYWRRRYARGNSQVKEAITMFNFAVGHQAMSVGIKMGSRPGRDRAKAPSKSL